MLYVCAVPMDADTENAAGTPAYILDIIPGRSSRNGYETINWKKYRKIFNYQRIWISEHEEMKYRNIVDVKFHKGEIL